MRRLPSWMLKVKTVEVPSKSATEVDKSTKPDNEMNNQVVEVKSNPLEKKSGKIQTRERKIKHQEDIIRPHKAKRRMTQIERNDEDAKKRSKRVDKAKASGNTSSSKQKMGVPVVLSNKQESKISDAEALSADTSDNEEVSLTVEDLLSIASEYVSADGKRQCKDQIVNDKSSEPSGSTLYSKLSLEGAILSKCTNNSPNSHPVRIKEKESSKENISNNERMENFCSSDISTGDAVQDMLNLYLGPFINKPAPSAEPSVKTVESENFSVVQAIERKRMPSVSEYNRQIGKFEIPKEEADEHLMKKKSSLRDKVALFID